MRTWFRNVNVIVSFLRLLSYWTERKSFKCSIEHNISYALKTVNNTQNIIMVLAWSAVGIISLYISHWMCARFWKQKIKCNKSLTVYWMWKQEIKCETNHWLCAKFESRKSDKCKTNHWLCTGFGSRKWMENKSDSTFLPCSSLSLSLSVTSDADMAFGRSILLAKISNTASRRSCSCNWNHEKTLKSVQTRIHHQGGRRKRGVITFTGLEPCKSNDSLFSSFSFHKLHI